MVCISAALELEMPEMLRDSEIEEIGDGYGVTYGGSRLSQSLKDKVVLLYACK